MRALSPLEHEGCRLAAWDGPDPVADIEALAAAIRRRCARLDGDSVVLTDLGRLALRVAVAIPAVQP